MTPADTASRAPDSRGRIVPTVALALLEVIRDLDRPTQLLEDENPSQTMPRRLGLSEVVEAQIRRYRTEAKNRRKLRDEEVGDLFQLVLRRPDAREVFYRAGLQLPGASRPGRARRSGLTRKFALMRARRTLQRYFKALFGRRMGGFAPGDFVLEGAGLFFFQQDSSGASCAMVTGVCEAVLERHLGRGFRVVHSQCQARGDALCRWEAEERSQPELGAAQDTAAPNPISTHED